MWYRIGYGSSDAEGDYTAWDQESLASSQETVQDSTSASSLSQPKHAAIHHTMFAHQISIRKNTCAQVFTNGVGFDLFYPLKKEKFAVEALNEVIRTVGVPKELVSDGAKAEIYGRFGDVAAEYRIKQRVTKPYSGWQNHADAAIREIKRGIRRASQRSRSPKRLWDYCGEWVAAIRRLTAHDIPSLHDRVPCEAIEGNTPDISEYAQFEWYQYK